MKRSSTEKTNSAFMPLTQIAVVMLFYLGIFAYYHPQLLTHPLGLISDHGDAILNYWMLTHGTRKLSSLSWHEFWSGNIFYPLDRTMSLSDTLLFQVLALAPWVKAGVPAIAVYNLSIALFFVLNGTISFLFLRDLTKDGYAALVGSAIFTVTGFWFGHLTHYQLLPTFWYPLIAWMLWLFYETKKTRYWALHCLGLVGLGLSSPYLFFLFVPPLGIIYVGLLLGWRSTWTPQLVTKTVAYLIWALGVIGIFYWPYLQAKALFGLQRSADEQALYSLHLKSVTAFAGQEYPTLLLGPARHYGEGHLYLGLWLLLSLPAMILSSVRSIRSPQAPFGRWLMLLALVLGVLCFWAALGPNTGGLGLLSLWKIWALIPGFDGIRVPARYGFLIHFFFGTAVALWMGTAVPRKWRKVVALGWVGFLILEMKPSSIPTAPFDQNPTHGVVHFLTKDGSGDPVVLLPLDTSDLDIFTLASRVQNGLVNGRSGWTPYLHEHFIWPSLQDCRTSGCLYLLKRLGVRFVVVSKRDGIAQETRDFFSRSLSPSFEDDYYRVFDLGRDHGRRTLLQGERGYLEESSKILRPITCDIPFTVVSDSWLDPLSLRPIPGGGWTSLTRQDLGPSLRFKLDSPQGEELVLRLTDEAPDIPSSQYVRRPWVEVFREGKKVDIAYWPDLSLHGGQLIQWINLRPAEEIDEIVIQAKPVRWVEMNWTIKRLEICRDSVTRPLWPTHL